MNRFYERCFLIFASDFPSSCDDIVAFLNVDNNDCVYNQPKNVMSTLQYKIEHILSFSEKNILSLHIRKIELVHFLSCRDESVKMAFTTLSPTKHVKLWVFTLMKK